MKITGHFVTITNDACLDNCLVAFYEPKENSGLNNDRFFALNHKMEEKSFIIPLQGFIKDLMVMGTIELKPQQTKTITEIFNILREDSKKIDS